jgi:ketosteroid isomerase-like protein
MMKLMAVVALSLGMAMHGLENRGLENRGLENQGFANPGSAPAANQAPGEGGTVDRAYLQKIWDGWARLDATAQKPYYAQGRHVFFDISPLKYGSWDQYQSGVSQELEDYNAARFTVNDDAEIHKSGDAYWITATVASDMTHKSGKREMATFRWTAVFEKQGTKWRIVHEHVSEPLP